MMVIVILALLTVGINQAIAHTIRIGSRGADSMTAIKQVEDGFHWVTIDAQQAQSIQPALDSGFPLKFSWVEWDGTQHTVTYSFNGTQIERHAVASTNVTDTVVARYIVTDASATRCRLTGNGTFNLPDINDTFTITGGQSASTGTILVTAGALTVTTTGTATYNAGTGAWSTPHAGDTLVIKAKNATSKGLWSASNTSALLGMTQDADGDAALSGSTLILTLTASGGDYSTHRETRQGLVFSRS